MGVSKSTVEYRELRRVDVPTFVPVILQGIGALERAAGLEATATAGVEQIRRPGIFLLLRLLQFLRIAPIRLLVAVERGQVVGTATVVLLENTGYVAGVATDSAARGRGIGTGVMELARSKALAHQKRWLALDVESENVTAIRLYRRMGYIEAARFAWYVGPTPQTGLLSSPMPTETKLSKNDARGWVSQLVPEAIRNSLPPTTRQLSHLEIFLRSARTPVKNWKLSDGGRVQSLVRGLYREKIKTGIILPIGTDSSLPSTSLVALIAPAIAWQRSLGATRIILPVREPKGEWDAAASSCGLQHAVSTVLMVRPTSP